MTLKTILLFLILIHLCTAHDGDGMMSVYYADVYYPNTVSHIDTLFIPPPKKKQVEIEEFFGPIEEQPEFPGGVDAMMKFVRDNMRYPIEARECHIEGCVVCNFVVERDGSLSDFQVFKGIDPLLDNEAIRILKLMPNFSPGKQRGKPVRVRYMIPVDFILGSSDSSGVQYNPFQKAVKAEFPGGEEAFVKYITENIKYPVIAQKNGIQGVVSTVFNVDRNGKVFFVRFEKSVDPSLDAEVKRVIENMPVWTPAKRNGEITSMIVKNDFLFRLHEESGFEPYKDSIPDNAIEIDQEIPYPIKVNPSDEVFTDVDEKPEFPGGDAAMIEWISDNFNFEPTPSDYYSVARIVVSVIVEKDGSLSDVKVIRSVDPLLDKEALRVVKSMPKWKPGRHNDERVRVRYNILIRPGRL